jgi:hypothetical protein
MTVSTATPERLPDIETLRRLAKSIAMLDAILCPEWEYRYYSYNSHWGKGEEMASMRNGCGDDWFLLFDPHGAALKGFAHEYPMAGDASFSARIQQTVPTVFDSFLHEPAFSMDMATFCLWRRRADTVWSVVLPANGRVSPEQDGSAELLGILDGNPETYRVEAMESHEREIPLSGVRALYDHQPLTDQLVSSLNKKLGVSDIKEDADEIGYPL